MKTFTPLNRLSAGIAIALATAGTAASIAAAGGEPKNEPPFISAVTSRALAQQLGSTRLTVSHVIRGEAKNQAPFTRR